MKVVEETPTRLVLRRRPWVLWGIGILLAWMGIMLGREIFLRSNFSGGVEGWLEVVATVIIGFIGAELILLPGTVTCTIDLSLHTLTLRRTRLMNTHEQTYSLNKIADFVLELYAGKYGDTYRAVIVLHTQEKLPLTNYLISSMRWQRTVDKLRTFTNMEDKQQKEQS